MALEMTPKLDTLPPAQKRLWDELIDVPAEVRERLVASVKAVDLDALPRLDRPGGAPAPEDGR